MLLQTLFENIHDKGKLLLSKNIVSIEHGQHSVTVRCDDKSSFEGDILVGADGVGSKTRGELWKLAEPMQPELVRHDKTCELILSLQYFQGRVMANPDMC